MRIPSNVMCLFLQVAAAVSEVRI